MKKWEASTIITSELKTMSSDPPPPITPNVDSNPLLTPANRNPSNIPVVTQPTQLTQAFDAPIDTPARDEIRNQQHTFTQDWLVEHAESNPSPLLEPSRIAPFPTPTIYSPVISRASSRRIMDETSNSNREIAAAACSMVSFSNRSRKKVYNPKDSLLSFLHDKHIETEMGILASKGSNTFDLTSTL